jgi:hypothetical protein
MSMMNPRLRRLIVKHMKSGRAVEAIIRELTKKSNAELLDDAVLFLLEYVQEHYLEQ